MNVVSDRITGYEADKAESMRSMLAARNQPTSSSATSPDMVQSALTATTSASFLRPDRVRQDVHDERVPTSEALRGIIPCL
jgi:hypothetical protein